MGTNRCTRNPWPDVGVGDVVIRNELQQVLLDAVVEHDTDRARLPAPPADAINLGILVVEGPSPFLA